VKILLESGVDAYKVDNDGCTPLYIASQKGYLKVVKYLVEECKAEVDKARETGESSLYVATQEGRFEVLKFLVEVGNAHVNKRDNRGSTPLFIAKFYLTNVSEDVVKYLKGKGAK